MVSADLGVVHEALEAEHPGAGQNADPVPLRNLVGWGKNPKNAKIPLCRKMHDLWRRVFTWTKK